MPLKISLKLLVLGYFMPSKGAKKFHSSELFLTFEKLKGKRLVA
jgi:hypothetical protein